MKSKSKERLDKLLVARGLVDTRAKAQALILAGQVFSNQQRLGGSSSPFDGDFEKDATAFKVRHVFGGGRMDAKTTVASNGSGS